MGESTTHAVCSLQSDADMAVELTSSEVVRSNIRSSALARKSTSIASNLFFIDFVDETTESLSVRH